ncbi:LamG-like jellyroll fold domain-containing protein, partial [Singulisphaera rosea]
LASAQGEPSGHPALSVGAIQSPGRFRILSGRATLLFLNGVILTLEGPTDIDLVSIDTIFCRQGRLRARIPKGGEGFVVISPRSVVVDHGAEFGLNVESERTLRVMVFEGTAEATLLDRSGVAQVTQFVDQGQEFEFDMDSGRVAEGDAQPSRYIQITEPELPELRLAPAYPDAVRRSRPKGFWRFESLVDGRVPNEVSDGPRLWANGPVAFSGKAEGNGFALFTAGSPGQFLTSGNLWKLSSRPGYAVEFWFLAENFGRASLVGLFPAPEIFPAGHRSRYVHAFLTETTAYEGRSLSRPGSVEFLRRWPLEVDVGSSIFSNDICLPRRWHHVVAQKDGVRMDLFVDGAWVHTTTQEPDHPDLYCRMVVGRRTIDPLNPMDSRSFVGRFDELAIYDHPLPAEQIREHFQLAAPPAREE